MLMPQRLAPRYGVTPLVRTAQQKSASGWTLPPDAADTKSPLTVDDKVLAIGKKIFTDKCQKCHGPNGLGDGPDADPDHAEDMNLTNPKRADRNPDGVVFYKVLNGRRSPKMPAFKDRAVEGADLVGRRVRADVAQEVGAGLKTGPTQTAAR